jgi:hypothetical protein
MELGQEAQRVRSDATDGHDVRVADSVAVDREHVDQERLDPRRPLRLEVDTWHREPADEAPGDRVESSQLEAVTHGRFP